MPELGALRVRETPYPYSVRGDGVAFHDCFLCKRLIVSKEREARYSGLTIYLHNECTSPWQERLRLEEESRRAFERDSRGARDESELERKREKRRARYNREKQKPGFVEKQRQYKSNYYQSVKGL
jgi:hypothetical protein